MRLFTSLLLTCFFVSVFAQSNEFNVYDNGLIYSTNTMNQLSKIVDSLNLKHRVCGSSSYLSKPQSVAHHIWIKAPEAKMARADVKNGISFTEFKKKYPEAKLVENLLIVPHYEFSNGSRQFKTHPIETNITCDQNFSLNESAGKWIYEERFDEEKFMALYLVKDFESMPIPEAYSRMIQYSDCMIDTSTQVFLEDMDYDPWDDEFNSTSPVTSFLDFLNDEFGAFTYNSESKYSHSEQYSDWFSDRIEQIDDGFCEGPEFKLKLFDAVTFAFDSGGSSDNFEFYVERYYSKNAALRLKRSRRVYGMCSMDNAPRYHAMNIAVLSAEAVNWEVFLRAHLDIMNDHFARVSDGSWAWKDRQTYIRELEELDINVVDLLLGICFRFKSPSENHYYGSIVRIGRALAETQFKDDIECSMIDIIADSKLDDFNRLIIYYLYGNYTYYLKEGARKDSNERKLKQAMQSLPEYLVENLKD
ncbi:MAG: hypothetical protein MRY83_20290 [Flavobacteriales bacterium]|nr:hypothetical protein [Flavobacteriales bacterium]